MPTRDTVLLLDSLVEATVALIDMKRAVDKADYDIQVLKTQLGLNEGHAGEEVKTDGMEVDESAAEGETGEDGRAQSVASARSSRSRKQVGVRLLSRAQASANVVS
jgi:DNA methyltransferase 1-associated protein 1